MNRSLFATLGLLTAAALTTSSGSAAAEQPSAGGEPTVVLVHGAFADSSSWNSAIQILERDG